MEKMNKELSDRVWKMLPKEFKEEVKEEYFACKHCSAEASAMELEIIFGEHNLTSDAEGEEMLCCEDYEPKPAEPKFKEGDRAIYCIPEKQRIKARVVNVRQRSGSTLFNTLFNYDIRLDDGRTANWVDEQWLLPDNDDQVRAVTEKASEHFDTIVKGGFRNERRLNIAAMLCAGMLANDCNVYPIDRAIELADKLIAKCEKGGTK